MVIMYWIAGRIWRQVTFPVGVSELPETGGAWGCRGKRDYVFQSAVWRYNQHNNRLQQRFAQVISGPGEPEEDRLTP